MDNEVMELIDELYSMVSEAWGVPLGNDKCIVERDKVLNMIEDIKAQLPVELSEAKRLVSARDEFIGNAKREAESIRRAAEEKAREIRAGYEAQAQAEAADAAQSREKAAQPARPGSAAEYNRFMHSSYDFDALEQELLKNG